MSESPPLPPHPNALVQSMVDACMCYAMKNGSLDYPAIREAMIDILADIISRQKPKIREEMVREFGALFTGTVITRGRERDNEVKIVVPEIIN